MNCHNRQGDVLMIARPDLTIEKLRDAAKLEAKNKCIVAEGEATGHAHRVQEAPKGAECIELFNLDSTRILYVPESFGTVPMNHEEHATVSIAPSVGLSDW